MKENMLVMNKKNFLGTVCVAVALSAVVSACGDGTTRSAGWEFSPNMYEPLAFNPDQPNPNFKDNKTAQLPPTGSDPIGFVRFEYPNTLEGYTQAGLEVKSPLAMTDVNLKQGEALFLTYCAVCHGKDGNGDGPLTKDRKVKDSRGERDLEKFPPPPSFHRSAGAKSTRGTLMADLSDGQIFHTITYGYNAMGSHASQLTPDERWKVVMYVHELQKK